MSICSWLGSLFDSVTATKDTTVYISKIPLYGQKGDHVAALQQALVDRGYKITVDGQFGMQTKNAVSAFQKSFKSAGSGVVGQLTLGKLGIKVGEKPQDTKPTAIPVNPAYVEAKKYLGKKETDKAFGAWLSGFWKIVGLPHYKTIVGASFAWCALFIAAMNSEVGIDYISKYGAAAKSWAKYGQAVDFKKNGIPQGAVMHINSNSCTSGSGNHVTFADGACTADYLATKGAVVPGLGGNQANQVKRSMYSAAKVCAVRWPSELPLPPKVTKNISCGSGTDSGESTK